GLPAHGEFSIEHIDRIPHNREWKAKSQESALTRALSIMHRESNRSGLTSIVDDEIVCPGQDDTEPGEFSRALALSACTGGHDAVGVNESEKRWTASAEEVCDHPIGGDGK